MKFLCNCSTFIQKSWGNSYFTLVKQLTDLFTEKLCQIAGLLSWTFTQIFFIAVTRRWGKIKFNSIEWVPTKSRKTNSILHPADEIWTNSSFLWMTVLHWDLPLNATAYPCETQTDPSKYYCPAVLMDSDAIHREGLKTGQFLSNPILFLSTSLLILSHTCYHFYAELRLRSW